jgi:hypothetical protein
MRELKRNESEKNFFLPILLDAPNSFEKSPSRQVFSQVDVVFGSFDLLKL